MPMPVLLKEVVISSPERGPGLRAHVISSPLVIDWVECECIDSVLYVFASCAYASKNQN